MRTLVTNTSRGELPMSSHSKQRLSRLAPGFYQGQVWVHWTHTLKDRSIGWLDPKFYYKFREVLTHVAFRNRLAAPIFCLMPTHIHILLCGLTNESDQLIATKQLRTAMNDCLKSIGFELQKQAYDHVLQDEEIEQDAIEEVINYIAHNPARKGIVNEDCYDKYPYTGCLLPGYPQFKLFQADSWLRLWRTISFLKRTNCFQGALQKLDSENGIGL